MKLDRLLSRIRAALQGYATEFEQRALAAEYAEWCAKAAHRLEQVVPLIREGQDFPALQIAESPPSVLDLIRQLSFAEAEQWRAYCHQRGLPVATPFDERSVDLVNQLYSKKISETHPLYREYRQAIRTRRDEQALRVLQSIRRINHDDANAHAEFARLAHKLFERRRGELATALDRHDTAAALALMDTLEVDDWPGRENDATWQRALKFREEHQLAEARARCLELAGQLRQLRSENRWADAPPVLAEWDSLRGQFNFTLAPEIETESASVREWATGLLTERLGEIERMRTWRSLTARLDEMGAQKGGKKSAQHLQAELAELTEKSSALAATRGDGHAPPPELLNRIVAEAARLRRQLRARKLRSAALIFAAAVAVLAVVAFGIGTYMRNVNRQALLVAIDQHYKDGAAGALDAALKAYDAKYGSPPSNPEWAKLLGDARDYAKTRLAALDRFNAELAQAREAATKPTPNQIAALFASLDNLDQDTADLGADDAQHAKASLQELRLQLNQKLAGDQDARAAHLADIFARANQIVVDKLTGPITADAAQAAVAEARKITAEADALTVDPGQRSPSENAAYEQLTGVIKKLSDLGAAADSVIALRTQLAQARTFDDYRTGIEALAPNLLGKDPNVAAAHALVAKKPDWAGAAQHLLLPGDPDTWAFLSQLTEARLEPATDNQKEDIDFSRLAHNDVLDNTYRADLVTYVNDSPTTHETIFLSGPPKVNDLTRDYIHEITAEAKRINPDGSISGLAAGWRQFTGQKGSGQKMENVQMTPEAKLYALLASAYDKDHNTIREPLLRLLDDVRADPDSSPILKAYFQQEITKIMRSRPRDWGLVFSPTAKKDETELDQITGGHLQPTDWLFTPTTSHLPGNLLAFYQRTAATSYYNEALANLQAALKTHATPILFAGYVGLDNAPHLAAAAPEGAALWGFNAAGEWHSLYIIHGGQPVRDNPPSTENAAAPLTPLVYAHELSASN